MCVPRYVVVEICGPVGRGFGGIDGPVHVVGRYYVHLQTGEWATRGSSIPSGMPSQQRRSFVYSHHITVPLESKQRSVHPQATRSGVNRWWGVAGDPGTRAKRDDRRSE